MKEGWQVESAKFERLRIIGPYADGKECLTWCYENDYSVIRSGPYSDREMFPRVDIERFLIIADREIVRDPELSGEKSNQRYNHGYCGR